MKTKDKVNKLRKYVNEYVKYTRWDKVAVYWDRFTTEITVTWYTVTKKPDGEGKLQRYVNFTQRKFYAGDLDERLVSYRNKINYAKSK
jgi:hypothetical protein